MKKLVGGIITEKVIFKKNIAFNTDEPIHQDTTSLINVHVLNNRASKYMKQINGIFKRKS